MDLMSYDKDGDGIVDADDQCPEDPEDLDEFEDQNGCPDPDRDGDGVPDRVDNCPDEPGTVENHGCKEVQLVVIGAGQLEILEKVYFRTGSAKMQKRSWGLLDNVAQVMNAHPEIKKVRVEGHSDSTGSMKVNMRLSKARADSPRPRMRWRVYRPAMPPPTTITSRMADELLRYSWWAWTASTTRSSTSGTFRNGRSSTTVSVPADGAVCSSSRGRRPPMFDT